MNQSLNIFTRWVLLASIFALTVCSVNADVVKQAKGEIEGRILENSAEVIVMETVRGEYLVLQKNMVRGITPEPEEEFYYRRGRYHESKGDHQIALLDYMEVLRRTPNHMGAQGRRDAIFYERKKSLWDQNLNKAEEHLDNQDYRQALASFQQVLELNPDDDLAQDVVKQMSDTYTRIAFLYFNHCYDEDAIVELTKAEELNPNSAEIYYVLARIHHNGRNYEQARLEYERALELDPNHNGARQHLRELIDQTRSRWRR
ncbi:MAG: tetratricopeptide repeat protein [Candidatus Hinthialibacter antarcticus]|nr:tetratricopeptide repeat protein [Candidatus Hinthialibacter antarcticus]